MVIPMIAVSIISRRLKEGKTYEDFRKAWYHTVGFGTASKMYTMINTFNPREIVVIGFVEMTPDQDLCRYSELMSKRDLIIHWMT